MLAAGVRHVPDRRHRRHPAASRLRADVVTVAETRYGRQGGRWLGPAARQDEDDICHTCQRLQARHLATNPREPDTPPWPICGRCADQAERHRASVRIAPLTPSTTTTEHVT